MEEAGIPTEEEGAAALAPAEPIEEEDQPLTKIERMEQQLTTAIEQEDYEKAAKLRDEIQRLQSEQQKN
jgi:protein-arginine kinase activator protein McsA